MVETRMMIADTETSCNAVRAVKEKKIYLLAEFSSRPGKFRFLASETSGMPDIIAENSLKKWNGSSYE